MIREAFPEEGLIELAGKRPTRSKSKCQGQHLGSELMFLAPFCFLDCLCIAVLPGISVQVSSQSL